MIGEVIRDFFLRWRHPKLVRQAIQLRAAEGHECRKGPAGVECPECGADLVVVDSYLQETSRTSPFRFVHVLCPSCALLVKNINTCIIVPRVDPCP